MSATTLIIAKIIKSLCFTGSNPKKILFLGLSSVVQKVLVFLQIRLLLKTLNQCL